ncbi:probable malate dehydrogenase, mitochondrial [Drosophila obscura]|uniref:probable malate dehydrogenase, mitochondrial n=1 Tax=Drosophila obscura TaxID=7282 RepID=UPI001BB2632C|nr:probable malate dehydrogenase, mitochondrial [Drosophila obscura]
MFALRCGTQLSQTLNQYQRKRTDAAISNGSQRTLKVAVVGAAGGIGQPLSMLLKHHPHIETLALHDRKNIKGVAADLSHIDTSAVVQPFKGPKKLALALKGSDIVVVPAGMPRKPGMSRADLLDENASIAVDVANAVSAACPGALLAFITNPINTIVPIVAEILKSKGVYDPRRLFGVTTLDVVRSKTFLGKSIGVQPEEVTIPVIGGHAGLTILPVLSQCDPPFDGDEAERLSLFHRIQEAGTEVVKAKAGLGSATLSMAFAGARFVDSLIRGIKNEGDGCIVECTFCESDVSEAKFFASPVILGPHGVQEYLAIPCLDDLERAALKCLIPILNQNIEAGIKYGQSAVLCGF